MPYVYVSLLIVFSSAENQPPNNTLTTDKIDQPSRLKKHNRTDSLPTSSLFQEPLKIGHTRTWSTPLTGDELDRAILEKSLIHSSCKAVNGKDILPTKKTSGCRRASTGQRFPKLSPAHTKSMYTTPLSITRSAPHIPTNKSCQIKRSHVRCKLRSLSFFFFFLVLATRCYFVDSVDLFRALEVIEDQLGYVNACASILFTFSLAYILLLF